MNGLIGVIIMVDSERKRNSSNVRRLHTEQTISVEAFHEVIDQLKISGLSGERLWDIIKGKVIQDGVAIRYQRPKRQAYVDLSETTPLYTHHYLALEPGLTGEAFRVFHYACSIMEFSNWCYLYPRVIAEKMQLKQQNVSRALKLLEEKGLLIRGEKRGRHYLWRLNPEVAWMGNNQHRWDLVEQDGVPYSDFVEKRLAWADENGYNLNYLRYLKGVTSDEIPNIALSDEAKAAKKEKYRQDWRDNQERQRNYNCELRTRLYGKKYANGIDWKNLPDHEAASLRIHAAQIESEMKESGEWDSLIKKYFPEPPKKPAQIINFEEKTKRKREAQQLAEELLSSDVDLDELREFLRKSGTE